MLVVRTDPRLDRMVEHLGYTSVPVGAIDARATKTDVDLVRESQERLRDVEIVPDDQLSARALAHLKLARAIAARVVFLPPAMVHAAIIPMASERRHTAGLYSKATQHVYISTSQLERARTTMDTLIHEVAHHNSGAEDLTEQHSEEMSRVAARVAERVAAQEFDAQLREAVW